MKCVDPHRSTGLTHAVAGSAETWSHTRALPSAVVAPSGTTNADRAPPTAWLSTRAGSAEGARTPEPSTSGSTRWSPATNRRAAAAT